MRLICSVSFLSSSAITASIDLTTSAPMSRVWESACSARVRTARSTASFASSVFGLNSLVRRASKSPTSTAPVAGGSCKGFGSAIAVLHSVHGLGGGLVLRLGGCRQRLEESGILQQPADKLLGPGLAVHVGDQVRKLLPRFEQFVQRV